MAPPTKPPVVEDLESTYYYLCVRKSDVDAFKIGYTDENHIPISVIGLWSTGPHVSGTGFIDQDNKSLHKDIVKFLSSSGIGAAPDGGKIDFSYIRNFQGSTVGYSVPSSVILSSTVLVPPIVAAYVSANPNALQVSAHIVYGLPGDQWWFFERAGESQPAINAFDLLKPYPYNVDLYYPTEDCETSVHIDGWYKITPNSSQNTGDSVDFHFEILCDSNYNSVYSPLLSSLEISSCFINNRSTVGPIFEISPLATMNGQPIVSGGSVRGMISNMKHYHLLSTPSAVDPTFVSQKFGPNRPGQIFRNMRVLAVIDASYDSGNTSITNVTRTVWGSNLQMVPNPNNVLDPSASFIMLPPVSVPTNSNYSNLLNGLVEAVNSYYANVIVFQTNGSNYISFGEWLKNYLTTKRTIYQGISTELLPLVSLGSCC